MTKIKRPNTHYKVGRKESQTLEDCNEENNKIIPWRINSNLGWPIHFLRLSLDPVKKLSATIT